MRDFRFVTPRLPVSDLARTRSFYEDLLGFSAEVLWPTDEPDFIILRRGGVRVGFIGPQHGHAPPGHVELYVDVDDIESLHESLAPHCEIEWGPEVYEYGRREFGLRDPDGYLLIFTEPA